MTSLMASAPTEIRTPVLALKGLRPSPLDDGGVLSERAEFYQTPAFGSSIIPIAAQAGIHLSPSVNVWMNDWIVRFVGLAKH